MTEERKCIICGNSFSHNKYCPNQEVCSSVECQYKRQLKNMAEWRKHNPDYFKYKEAHDESWKETCKTRSLEWRHKHTEYLKLYRDAHKQRHRDYMKDYMREYRKRNKGEAFPEEKNAQEDQ